VITEFYTRRSWSTRLFTAMAKTAFWTVFMYTVGDWISMKVDHHPISPSTPGGFILCYAGFLGVELPGLFPNLPLWLRIAIGFLPIIATAVVFALVGNL
jgi:hypothetical protein